jgi:hypothetical protein
LTLASTTAAAARRPRSRQWGIGEYEVAGQLVYFEVSWDDWRRDTAWARGLLADYGVSQVKGDGPGGTGGGSPPCVEKVGGGLVIVAGMAESPWFDPFETAACELGAPYSIGEIYAFEAFRTGLYASRLPVTMIFGLDRTVAEGLGDELAAVVARVPAIVARPDAVGLLAGAGARPFVVTRVGPAIAVECPYRAGAHVNGAEWTLAERGGELFISTAGPRAHQVNQAALDLRGTLTEGPCGCGRPGQRIIASTEQANTEQERTPWPLTGSPSGTSSASTGAATRPG